MMSALDKYCPENSFLTQSLHYLEKSDVLYLNNAKSGCSTIKAALLHAADYEKKRLPDHLDGKIIHGDNIYWSKSYNKITPSNTKSFSCVRNPYTRVLSAYLDKIHKKGILRNQFYIQNGLRDDYNLTFREFLNIIYNKNDGCILDQHYRPQFYNLFSGYVNIKRVYFLESIAQNYDDLSGWLDINTIFETRAGHKTGALEKLRNYLDDDSTRLIQEIYKLDFDTFGYSYDPKDCELAPSDWISLPAESDEFYFHLQLSASPKNKRVDLAKRYKRDNGNLSFYHKAAIAYLSGASRIIDLRDLEDEAVASSIYGSPGKAYSACSMIARAPKERFGRNARTAALERMSFIAPYFHQPRIQLIKSLINRGQNEEALQKLSILEKVSWRKGLITELSQQVRPENTEGAVA